MNPSDHLKPSNPTAPPTANPSFNEQWDKSCTDAKLALLAEFSKKLNRLSQTETKIRALLLDDDAVHRELNRAVAMQNANPPA